MEHIVATVGQITGKETSFEFKNQNGVIQFLNHVYKKADTNLVLGTERFTLSCDLNALSLIEQGVTLLKGAGWDVITTKSLDGVRVIVNPTEEERTTKIKGECEKLNAYATANSGSN